MTILSRLLALVAAALLPAIAIQAYNELDLRRTRQVEVQKQALSLATLAAEEQQQLVQGVRQALVALSELPAIKAKDSEACELALAGMKSRFPAFLTFVVTDAQGQPFCDTNPHPKQFNVSDRPYFVSAMKTGEFTVGEYSVGLSLNRRIIQFVLPFYGYDGQIGGVVIAPLGLDWLADYIARKNVPVGDAIAITDRNGIYLARYPLNSKFVGKKSILADADLQAGHGLTVDLNDVDGVERIVGFATLSPESGALRVSFGLNKAKAFSEIQSRTRRGILLITLSATLVLVLTLLGARHFVHRPLGQLVDAANQWRLGQYGRRVDIKDKSEIARVADAFNTMADSLERREKELFDAKEKAEDAVARLTTVLESTADSVIIADRDWSINFFNQKAWLQIAEGRELIGMSLEDLLMELAHDNVALEFLRKARSEGRPVSFETRCAAQSVWYAVNAFPSGEGIAIFFRDITEHKNAVAARRVVEEQLHQSQKMESVGQLTGGVAHDFNNLLAVVSANLELIEGAADNSNVRRFATTARRAVDRGAKLTSQLLAFSRRQELNPKLVNAGELIGEFQGLVRQAVGAGCEVKLRSEEPLWLCQVDPSLLETALLNLALNGRDAMPDGGVLEIETGNVVLEEGAVTGCPAGSYVRLSVIDNGEGMAPEVLDRIFEPFFTTKDVGKGTGLGLSMVYGFVRQSGGHIAVTTELGVGTTISLYLPRAVQQYGPVVMSEQKRPLPRGSERILLVEDNEELLEVTQAMLTTFGYEVTCARNGTEAIRVLESCEPFDLLFSDVVMSNGPNGVELAREAQRRSHGIKTLLSSGYAGDVLAREHAVDEFPIIHKPFRVSELAQCLRSVLDTADERRAV
jgi:PAS domain S-box-containing protein